MTDGELRTLLVEQLRLMLGPMLEKRRTPNTAENAVDVYCDLVADVVLAVLRPHLGLGVTEEDIDETGEAFNVADIAIEAWIDGLKDNGTAKDLEDAAELQRSLDVIRRLKRALVEDDTPAIAGRGEAESTEEK